MGKHQTHPRHTKSSLPCRVVDCDRPIRCKGLCGRHYEQARHGMLLNLRGSDEKGLPVRVRWIDAGGWEGDSEFLAKQQEEAEKCQHSEI